MQEPAPLPDGIFRAFLTYKREQEIRLNGSSQTILPEDLPQPEEKTSAPADATPETEKKADRPDKQTAPQAFGKSQPLRRQRTKPLCSRYRYSPLPVRWPRTTSG